MALKTIFHKMASKTIFHEMALKTIFIEFKTTNQIHLGFIYNQRREHRVSTVCFAIINANGHFPNCQDCS